MLRSRVGLLSGALMVLAIYCTAPFFANRIAYAIAEGQNQAGREKLGEMAKQDTLSPLFAEVAKVLEPAVVEVRVTKKVKMDQEMPDMQDFLRRFFGEQGGPPSQAHPQPREYLERGLGSGVIVDAKKGYILTNYHVVAKADQTRCVWRMAARSKRTGFARIRRRIWPF